MPKNDDSLSFGRSESFIRHLEETSDRLRSWPEWKRNMIGPALPEDRRTSIHERFSNHNQR